MENISTHISYSEATKSDTAIRFGIDNNPTEEQLERMKLLAEKVFEPTRSHFGNKSIRVTSFFRSGELNKKVGGSTTSQHCYGEAMDIDNDGSTPTNKEIFDYIKDNLDFDQLIWEAGNDSNPDWVHVSYKKSGNRKQVIKMKYVKGADGKVKSVYENYK